MKDKEPLDLQPTSKALERIGGVALIMILMCFIYTVAIAGYGFYINDLDQVYRVLDSWIIYAVIPFTIILNTVYRSKTILHKVISTLVLSAMLCASLLTINNNGFFTRMQDQHYYDEAFSNEETIEDKIAYFGRYLDDCKIEVIEFYHKKQDSIEHYINSESILDQAVSREAKQREAERKALKDE